MFRMTYKTEPWLKGKVCMLMPVVQAVWHKTSTYLSNSKKGVSASKDLREFVYWMGISLSVCLSATTVFLWLTESAQTAAESEGLWDPFHDRKHQQPLYQTISIIRPFTFDFNYRPVKFYDTVTVTKISWSTSQQTNTNIHQSIWDCASSQRHLQDHKFSQRYTAAQGEINTSHASGAGNKPEQTIGPNMKPQNNRFFPVTIISDETWVDLRGGAENTEK